MTAINHAPDVGARAAELAVAQHVLVELAGVLGFDLRAGYEARTSGSADAAAFIDVLVTLRSEARADNLAS